MHVRREGAGFVDDSQSRGECRDEDGAALPVAVTHQSIHIDQAAWVRVPGECATQVLPVVAEMPQELEAGLQPVSSTEGELAREDGIGLQDFECPAFVPQDLHEGVEPGLGGVALQLPVQAGEVQLEHERAVDHPQEVGQKIGRQQFVDLIRVETGDAGLTRHGARLRSESLLRLRDERPDDVQKAPLPLTPTQPQLLLSHVIVIGVGMRVRLPQLTQPSRWVPLCSHDFREVIQDATELLLTHARMHEPLMKAVLRCELGFRLPPREPHLLVPQLRLSDLVGHSGAGVGAQEGDTFLERQRTGPAGGDPRAYAAQIQPPDERQVKPILVVSQYSLQMPELQQISPDTVEVPSANASMTVTSRTARKFSSGPSSSMSPAGLGGRMSRSATSRLNR